jgi:hypothetical protein
LRCAQWDIAGRRVGEAEAGDEEEDEDEDEDDDEGDDEV